MPVPSSLPVRPPRLAATLEAVFEAAPDAIVVVDESLRIARANPAAVRLSGQPLDQLLGSAIAGWIPKRHRDAIVAGIEAVRRASGERARPAAKRSHVLCLAGGRALRVRATLWTVRLQGRVFLTAILRDVGDRRRPRRTLADTRARLEAALAAMSDGLAIAGAHGEFLALNEAFARFHRFPRKADFPHDVAGLAPLLEAFDTDGQPVPAQQWAIPRALRGETGSQVELRLRRRDTGQSWYASCNFAPIRDVDGAIAGAVITARDVTELRQAREKLERYSRNLRALVNQMHTIEEAERQRIARELHDELQQKLAAMSLDLASLASHIDIARPESKALLGDLETLVLRAIDSTRRIVRDLRPQLLDELGLSAALESMGANFESRTGVRTEVEILGADHADAELGALAATALYRIAQESLNNVLKHAHARFVHLMLDATSPHQVELSVTDDGVGIAGEHRIKPSSYGLQGMAERVRALGGRLVIVPQPEGGTMVQAIVPKTGCELEQASAAPAR
jgi:PAS domain S-box-containing protein